MSSSSDDEQVPPGLSFRQPPAEMDTGFDGKSHVTRGAARGVMLRRQARVDSRLTPSFNIKL